MSKFLPALAALSLTALTAPAAFAEGDPAKGEIVFKRCAACHVVEEGVNRIGPSLHGVFGRTSGSVEGFRYSNAMASADIVWTEETIKEYLQNPRTYVPGNRMAFPGLRNEQQLDDLIAYLKQATGAES
ncbi:MAG: c-type cytochrome [Rhodothalassiaceae bacterium]